MKKRVLSLLLVFVMVLGMLPVNAFAAELLTGYNFSLNADKDVIQAGESVTLTVELDNTIPVEAGATMIQFELWYDSTVVKETSMSNGPDYTHVPTGGAENDFGEIGKGVTTFGWCADDNEPVEFPAGILATIVYTAVEDIAAESLETTFALELYVCDYISEDLVVATPEVTVTVEKPAEEPVTKYGIDVSGSNGTVEADKAEAAAGETVTLTATPNDGYEFGSFQVLETENYDEVSIEFTELGNNQYSFVMPAYGLDITGIFALGAASVDDAGFVIKVNDVEMELVDGGSEACTSRYVSNLFRIINVTVPYGTTTVTVERTNEQNSPNIQYMSGTSHTFGGNAMPTFEADVVNYDGLCISCGGKYYHVTFTVEEKAGAYQSITTDMEGNVLVTEQEMIDGWIPYYHAVVPRGSGYAYVTYPADTIYVYGGQALVVEYAFDNSYSPQKQWPATENTHGSVTVAVPITDLLVEEIGTGYAVCFWKADGGEVLEGFTFSYAEDTTVFLVTLAAGNGYTTDGAGYVKNGEDYSFTVDIKNGYDATNMVVKVNGEVVTPDENGVYTVTNVTADLVITVEGVEAIPSDGDVTFYFSVEEGDHFVEQGGVVWALEEVTVPYFDLAAYGMEYLYYNPDCYSEGQASQAPGTKEQADGVVTMLHALIWLTEVYYNDLEPADAGQGWLYENGWPGFSVYSATAGSAFFHMWDFGYNFNYYMNYEYPLGYPGWGATCDQIKLSDGDVVSMRYNDNSGNVGTYHHFGEKALVTKTVNKGQSFDLDIYRTGEDYANYTTPVYLVGEGHKVYLFAKDEIETTPASGTLMATTDENGKVTIDTTDLELGTYYLVSNSTSPAVMLLTIEGGDHIHEYDAVVTDPTCTERGYTTYTCECGDSYVSDYTDPTGHNFVDGECANGCGTTATVIPEEALFTDITCDVPGVITVTYEGVREWYPYFHVVLPADATKAYVTFPADSVQGNGGYAWVRGIDFTGETWATDYSPTYTVNEDGTWTIELSINNFYAEEAWQGIAACFWKDGSVNQAISFCNAAGEGGEEPVEPEYKSEYGITVMVGDEEMDLVDNGTETCGVMQAQKLNVTVPAGTTEVTFLNITDTVVYGQMYIYSGAHDWTEYASNVTEATINLEECGTSFCISDSANNWYHVTIVLPHEHSYEAVVTKPTCTEGGYTTYTCSCGDSYIADETDALGHSYVAGVCTRCGKEDADYVAPTVTVFFSISDDANYLVGAETGEVMALKEITVPYFDLALYGLEGFYFSSETYGDDGDGLPGSDLAPGTPEYADGKVTLLHLYIYALEVYYCGVDPQDAGKGYLYEEGLMDTEILSVGGSQGSAFLNYIWGVDMNLNYYVNYEYPLASEGWGATCDQILLRDGDIMTLGHFTGWSFYSDPTSIFNYIVSDNDNPTQGDEITLTLYHAGADFSGNYTTAHTVIDYCPDVYYVLVDELSSGDVTEWTYLGTAEADGTLVVDTSELEAGEYIIAIAGQYGEYYPDEICSTPGGVILTVETCEHSEYSSVVTAPTCTEGGYTTYTCKQCGHSYTGDKTAALGHTEVVDAAVAPTCTTTGLTEGKKCSVCGDILVAQTEVAALGHTWDEGKVTTDPTCTAEGVKTFTCTVEGCNGTKTEPVAALGHTVDEKTWKHDGTNHWHECETCGEKLDTAKHSGGKATTEKKAVCDVCDAEYGALASTTPQTGDNSMIGAFILLMVLSAAALVLLMVYRKRWMA